MSLILSDSKISTTQDGLTIEKPTNYADDIGVANAYVVDLVSPLPGYIAGMKISFKAANTNTGASTLNVSGLEAKTIKRPSGTALIIGDIPKDAIIEVIYDGTSFVLCTALSKPSFLAYNSATRENVTGDGTGVICTFDSEVFDIGGNFASNTFTAPTTGKYQLNANVYFGGLLAGHYFDLILETHNRNYAAVQGYATFSNTSLNLSVLADMDAGDTARVTATASGGTKVVDIYGGANGYTSFSGFLVL